MELGSQSPSCALVVNSMPVPIPPCEPDHMDAIELVTQKLLSDSTRFSGAENGNVSRAISSPFPRVVAHIIATSRSSTPPEVHAYYLLPRENTWRCLMAVPLPALEELVACYAINNDFLCISSNGKLLNIRMKPWKLSELVDTFPNVPCALWTKFTESEFKERLRRTVSDPKYSSFTRTLLQLRGQSAAKVLEYLANDRHLFGVNSIGPSELRLIQDISSASEQLPLSLWLSSREVRVDMFGDLGHGGEAGVYHCEWYTRGQIYPMATRKTKLSAQYTKAHAVREALTHYLLS
ncbi:hypothetical protein DL93DRAFT_2159499, partial [Clavulina sp. PMI_390]